MTQMSTDEKGEPGEKRQRQILFVTLCGFARPREVVVVVFPSGHLRPSASSADDPLSRVRGLRHHVPMSLCNCVASASAEATADRSPDTSANNPSLRHAACVNLGDMRNLRIIQDQCALFRERMSENRSRIDQEWCKFRQESCKFR